MKHNWKHIKFGDAFNLQMGKTPARANSAYWSNGLYDWVSISDMPNGKYIQGTKEKISQKAVDEIGIHLVKKGTALMSFKLTIGKTAIAPYDLYTNEAIMAFEPKDGTDVLADFLYYYLQLYEWDGNRAVMGNTTNKGVISNSYAYIPSLSEQESIVAELDGINHLIDLQEEQLREYDRLAQSLFYTTFGDPVSNPKGWEVKKLGDYFHIGSSKRVFQSEWKSKGVPFYRAREVVKLAKDGFVDNELFIDEELYTEYASKYGIPVAGDILVTGVGTLGITYIVKENDRFYYKDGNIICLHKNTDIESLFIDFLFKTPYLRSQIENCSGATVGTYTIDRAKKTEIIVPPLELQQTFAAQIEAIEQQKALIRRSLDETRTLLAARMQYYFE